MFALLCTAVRLCDPQYQQLIGHLSSGDAISSLDGGDQTLFIFYAELCARCAGVEAFASQLSQEGVKTYIIDCAACRSACAAYRGRTAPLAVLWQKGVEHELGSGELSYSALLYEIKRFQQPLALLSADAVYYRIQEENPEVYIIAEVCATESCAFQDIYEAEALLWRLERWRDDRAVLIQAGTRNQLTAHRYGVIIKAGGEENKQVVGFVDNNLRPLVETSDFRIFRTYKRRAVLFTADHALADELLVYVRTLHIDRSALLDEFEFFISRSQDLDYYVYFSDFPFVLVVQQDAGYFIYYYYSAHHLNRFLNDITAGREDPLYLDPDNVISASSNFDVQYVNLNSYDDARRGDDENEDENDGDDDYYRWDDAEL